MVLPFVGLVPLALFVASRAPGRDGRASAVRGGFLFGVVYFGLLLHWIALALLRFTWTAPLAWAAVVTVLAGVAASVAWTLHRALGLPGVRLWWALPVAWTAGEWLRAHLPGSFAFPWLGLGTALTGTPELAGAAELVGARGLGFWMALVNGLVATAVLRAREGAAWGRWAVAAAGVAAVPMAWGVWRAADLEVRDALRVAVVQPGIPEEVKRDPARALDSTFASLDRLLPTLAPGAVDLVVLPEVVLPLYAGSPAEAGRLERVRAWALRTGAPVLFGALGHEGDLAGRYVAFNSAFLMEPSGLSDFRYDKRRLVPGVERVPFGLDGWLAGPAGPGSFGVGSAWTVGRVPTGNGVVAFGVLVCYESADPGAARAFRSRGADVLVNLTNDAWFGGAAPWARTGALWQHPAHLVMRAIETRVGVARAANTGFSLFVDPVGRVRQGVPLFEAGVATDTVRTTDVVTLYARLGDWVGSGAALAALGLLAASFLAEPRAGAHRRRRADGRRGLPDAPASGAPGARLDPSDHPG